MISIFQLCNILVKFSFEKIKIKVMVKLQVKLIFHDDSLIFPISSLIFLM